jgi:pimeloyl-ACP methyl ester carboxylesterase
VYRPVKENVEPPADWTQSPDPLDVLDDAKTSLYFEVWERLGVNPVDVVVVFRGTHELKDWWSNARWVTRFIPIGWDQYDKVRREIPNVVARAGNRHRSVRVMSAGHSLGGGLAQQAAYASPDIKQVYAFDPSPVTGFQSVPQPARDNNRTGIVIDRVFERGEILAYIRTFLRRFVPLSLKDPSITEIRFSLRKGDPVTQHSMVDLAERMKRAARTC